MHFMLSVGQAEQSRESEKAMIPSPSRRQILRGACGIAAALGVPRQAAAVAYPTRPVRFVVGFPAGGTADLVGRLLCHWLSERLGQSFFVENRPGAATNIAVQALAKAAPDGYTLGSIGVSNAINATLYRALSFDFQQDIAAVAGLVNFPLVIEVNPAVPASTIAELIAHAKSNPGRLSLGSFGTGTISHLAGDLLKAKAGIEVLHVPYRGAAPMLTDLLAGQIHAAVDSLPSSLPHIQQETLRALAVTTQTRIAALPDVPTVGETFPGYEAIAWTGVGAPRNTPAEVIGLLNREVNAGLSNALMRTRLAELGATPMAFGPGRFAEFIAGETEKWGQVVRNSGAKPD